MITTETRLLHIAGALWIATIRSIHQQELGREPQDSEIALHMAWILEQHDGGWDADKIRAHVRSLDEWANKQNG